VSNAKQTARQRELEFENRKLAQELDEYRREHSDIQDQAVTVVRLRERVKQLEASVDSLASERAKAREAELQSEAERASKQFREKEQLLLRRVAQAEQQVAALQRSNDDTQSQLFDLASKRDDELASLQSEIDLLSQELERRATTETQLRIELAAAQAAASGRAASAPTGAAEGEQLRLREEELAAARDAQLVLERRLESELSRYHDRLAELTQEQRVADERLRELQAKLSAAPSADSFAALQRQVETFRALGFDVDDGAAVAPGQSGVGGSGAVSAAAEIERVLRDTIRQRESAAAAAQVAKVQAEQRAAVAEQRIAESESERSRLAALVGKLEADLALRLASSDVLQLAGASSNSNDAFAQLKATDDATPLLIGGSAGAAPASNAPASLSLSSSSASSIGVASDASASLLQVVCAQRDRLQQRIVDLEAESSALASGREHVTEEAKQLREDNVKLYEKIRYLESYNADAGKRRRRDLEAATTASGEPDDVERRYRPLYEASVSPFAQFATLERERRYTSLSGVERVVMLGSSIFLRNKLSRIVLFLYISALHLLVFLTLNRHATARPEAVPGVVKPS
jgi:homeobox protein cut-like